MSLLSVTASRVGAPLRAHSRTFAKAAAAKKTDDSAHQPLIKLFGIPARYANAAYSAASKTNSLDKVEVSTHRNFLLYLMTFLFCFAFCFHVSSHIFCTYVFIS